MNYLKVSTTATTTATDNNNNSQPEPDFQGYNYDFDPIVIKYHAFIRSGEYLPKFQTLTYIDYYILHLLRLPISTESIRYYEENYRMPIIMRKQDGTISVVKDDKKLASLNEARVTGSKHLLYPLKLQTRRFHNVTLDDIDSWQQEIEQERQQFENLDNPVPIYQDIEIVVPGYEYAQLPLLEEWIGAISSSDWDRNQCVKLIVEATSDLPNLHEHTSTNRSMYSLEDEDERGHNQDDIFEHHSCLRW